MESQLSRSAVDPDLPRGTVAMLTETIEARGHTTQEGVLNLSGHVGLADADVAVVMRVKPLHPASEVDENGWPRGFFERVAGG